MDSTQATPVLLPTTASERKKIPLATGVIDYFTSALIEIAKVSFAGNEQHNPGQPLHWARGKSNDHADTMLRHFTERGTLDTDGQRHSAKMAWRALAILQTELEAEGKAPLSRGSSFSLIQPVWPDRSREDNMLVNGLVNSLVRGSDR